MKGFFHFMSTFGIFKECTIQVIINQNISKTYIGYVHKYKSIYVPIFISFHPGLPVLSSLLLPYHITVHSKTEFLKTTSTSSHDSVDCFESYSDSAEEGWSRMTSLTCPGLCWDGRDSEGGPLMWSLVPQEDRLCW